MCPRPATLSKRKNPQVRLASKVGSSTSPSPNRQQWPLALPSPLPRLRASPPGLPSPCPLSSAPPSVRTLSSTSKSISKNVKLGGDTNASSTGRCTPVWPRTSVSPTPLARRPASRPLLSPGVLVCEQSNFRDWSGARRKKKLESSLLQGIGHYRH